MLQGLDPVMETIVHDLDMVTNFRGMGHLNHIWDMKNGRKFGTIEGADSHHDDYHYDDSHYGNLFKGLLDQPQQAESM